MGPKEMRRGGEVRGDESGRGGRRGGCVVNDDGYRWSHGGGVGVHSFTGRRVFSWLGRFAQDFGELTDCRDFGSYGERRCKERRREREEGEKE